MQLDDQIVKLVSVFNVNSTVESLLQEYQEDDIENPDHQSYFKDTYLEEFRELVFPFTDEESPVLDYIHSAITHEEAKMKSDDGSTTKRGRYPPEKSYKEKLK